MSEIPRIRLTEEQVKFLKSNRPDLIIVGGNRYDGSSSLKANLACEALETMEKNQADHQEDIRDAFFYEPPHLTKIIESNNRKVTARELVWLLIKNWPQDTWYAVAAFFHWLSVKMGFNCPENDY